tara:strand:- start:1922 stop:2437 length:516 start_codon:yes stop_codon:yes gene_type:complete
LSWGEHDGIKINDINVMVVIASDSLANGERDLKEDKSSDIIIEKLKNMKITKIKKIYSPDDKDVLSNILDNEIKNNTDLIIISGGTGISNRDNSFEVLNAKYEKIIMGFGEEFRRKSIEEIGYKGIMSRASAGVSGKSVIFSLPGSKNAVRLGMKIISEIINHIIEIIGEN